MRRLLTIVATYCPLGPNTRLPLMRPNWRPLWPYTFDPLTVTGTPCFVYITLTRTPMSFELSLRFEQPYCRDLTLRGRACPSRHKPFSPAFSHGLVRCSRHHSSLPCRAATRARLD